MHRFFIVYVLAVFSAFMAFVGYSYFYMDESAWATWSSEDGVPERCSAILFGVIAFLSFIVFFVGRVQTWLYFAVLMALASMREMDLHRAWTTDSILKSNFYKNPDIGWDEKMAGGLVILLLVYCAIYFIRRVPAWIGNLWRFQGLAWAIGLGLGSLTVAKLLDSMARWLPFLAEFHGENRAFLGVIEESLEMAGAMFFFLVCLYGVIPVLRKKH